MKMSIIVATFNASEFLPRLLESIKSQTLSEVEVVVVDGGSKDEVGEIVEKYQSSISIVFISEPDSGIYDAWNKGVSLSSGEWISFMGADDEFSYPEALSDIYSIAYSRTGINLVSSLGSLVNWRTRDVLKRFGGRFDSSIKYRMTLCHPGLFHKRILFSSKNFDIKWKICADYDFLLRSIDLISPIFLNKVTVNVGDGGVSRIFVNKVLRETFSIQASVPYIGFLKAFLYYIFAKIKFNLKKIIL
ncbi:PGL/p-HBAD biosynthesis glycosyltransferase [Comamonadaceae bacterium OS-1]|nr:PGL/p-HBAD biosynthesis glycosyltransferase [Comamonadaceae bacterium OS-1]